ncbi:MAG: hypothetical protein ABSE73_32180 [Planctomycetota bacterium]
MKARSILPLLLALGTALFLSAQAGEYQVRTADGQTLQGEYLGTEDGVVKLRTKYGVQQVPFKDVLAMTQVVAAPKPAPAEEPADKEPAAEQPAAEKEAAPPPPPKTRKRKPKEKAKAEEPAPEAAAENEAVPPPAPPKAAKPGATEGGKEEAPPPPPAFAEPKMPDPVALAKARAAEAEAEDPRPQPRTAERQAIERALNNFMYSNQTNRGKIIRLLQGYGRMADQYIACAFTNPGQIDMRVEILEVLAVPGNALSTPVFAEVHRAALASMEQTAAGPEVPPPDYLSKQDRNQPLTRSDFVKVAASNVLDLEGYMSTAGGPFSTLFLLDVYRKRYTSDKTEQSLLGVVRDRTRLAAAAADAGRTRSEWTKAYRVSAIELALPMLFKDDSALQTLAQGLLTKLLPSTHPKWTAPEEDWVKWWEKTREKIK